MSSLHDIHCDTDGEDSSAERISGWVVCIVWPSRIVQVKSVLVPLMIGSLKGTRADSDVWLATFSPGIRTSPSTQERSMLNTILKRPLQPGAKTSKVLEPVEFLANGSNGPARKRPAGCAKKETST